MILVDRGPEPLELENVRREELERLRHDLVARRRPTSDDIGKRYTFVKEALWQAQNEKCCYCECREQLEYRGVEHFRPKSRADRRPGAEADHGYWWLAWTWENLLFACEYCNRSAKRDLFPLDHGSVALMAEEPPPGEERWLLIDPAAESGIEHIQFVPARLGDRRRWIPRPRGGSSKGRWSIRVCRLDRPSLLTAYSNHVQHNVIPQVRQVETAIASEDAQAVRHRWAWAVDRLLNPYQIYVGLSFDSLDHFFPQDLRETWRLELPLPLGPGADRPRSRRPQSPG